MLVYLAALALGAGILGITAVAGGHGGHAGGGHDVHVGHDGAGHAHGTSAGWMLLSTRFWTFALLAFGLVGTMLTGFHLAGPLLTAVIAAPVGIGAGAGAAATMRALASGKASSTASLDEAVGQVGRVLLPPGPGRAGKVRLQLRGQDVDLIARTDETGIAAGDRVVIDELKDGVAQVARAPKELGS